MSARPIAADEKNAKVAILALNRVGGQLRELEEAWIVRALVREDGLQQNEVAELLGHHKSWVCRRLALLERLCEPAKQDLSVGLFGAGTARELIRLPAGNQEELLDVIRREELSRDEVRGVVDLLIGSPDQASRQSVLDEPRESLARSKMESQSPNNPQLSPAGNRMVKQIGYLLEALPRMENWFRHRGRLGIHVEDLPILCPLLEELAREARSLAESADDVVRSP